MWKQLRDETTWHGKAIKGVLDAPKVLIVLLFFTAIFAVIAVDSLVLRRRNRAFPKRALRSGGAGAGRP